MSKNPFLCRKLLFLLISLITLALLCTVALTSCGSSVSDIIIKDYNKPRTTFVQGQELDFSSGVLTVMIDGNETDIPFSDPEVSITGYNKDTLGKQTVTVTYKEKSTTIEVNVVARMVADGFKSNYFINDSFDNSQGKLKITKDDGKTQTVNLNSEYVTVKTFNTSAAGDSAVTVLYNDGKVSYEATFSVKVYDIAEVVFTAPRKTVYSSHETELSLAGGYFTVKAANSDFSAMVPLTADMQTGFDLSAATPAHRENALQQTLVFTYPGYTGKSFNFNISILYSSVSVVKDAAKALSDVTITDRNTVIPDELKTIAVDAASEYFKLTPARKALIDENELLKVMRPAAFCVQEVFNDAAAKFEHLFGIDSNSGNLLVNAKSYDALKASISDFENKDEPFNVYAVTLNSMKEEFGDVLLFEEEVDGNKTRITIKGYIKSPSADELSFYVDLFKYMLNVSDMLAVVPKNWTESTLSEYESVITETFNYIVGSGFTGPSFNGVYNSISSWRENDDFFEIIYTYYIYVVGDKEAFFDSINSEQGLKLHLPGELQTWYTCLSSGAYELSVMRNNINNMDIRLYDTTRFMYYYSQACEAVDAIKSSDNKLYKDIYDFIGGDIMTYSYLQNPNMLGYYYHVYTMVESKAFTQLWDSYMELATVYYSGKVDLIEDADKINAVLRDMAKLTPGEFYGFICSLNFLYGDPDTAKYAFDHNDQKVHSILAYLVAYYDVSNFGDARVLMQLLFAAEKCAVADAKGEGFEAFRTEMETFLTMFGALSDENQRKFKEIAGGLYDKYVDIYNSYGTDYTPELGEWSDKYNDLKNAIADFYTVTDILSDTELTNDEKKYYFPLLFTISERAISLYSDIIENGTDAAVKATYTLKYTFGDTTTTLDNAMIKLKGEFYYNMVFTSLNYGTQENPINISFWLSYSEMEDLRAFMISASHVLMAAHNDTAIDKAAVKSMLESFRALTDAEKATFHFFGMNIYYDVLLEFFTIDGTSSDLVRSILQTEIGYIEYMKDTTDTGRRDYFSKIIAAAESEYNKLDTQQQSELDQLLKDIYNYYLEKYEQIA